MELLAVALAESLDKPFQWAVGFLFGNTELSLELWTVIAGISGLDDSNLLDIQAERFSFVYLLLGLGDT